MLGRIAFGPVPRVTWDRELILDMPFGLVTLPRSCRPRQIRKGARLLRAHGVKRVVAPEGFLWWDTLARYGLKPVEPGPFCRGCAALLALAVLPCPREASVVLRGERVTRAMRLCALELCPEVRRVLIAAPLGGEALQRELCREYGMPVVEDRPGRSPDLAIHFSPAAGEGRVLDLSGPRPGLGELTLALAAELPAGADRLALLAALWENGRLPPGSLWAEGPAPDGRKKQETRT